MKPAASWGRSRELLSLAAGVAGHEIRGRVRARLTSSVEKLASTEIATRVAQAQLMVGGAFAFSDPDYAARSQQLGMRFVTTLRHSAPPRHLLFLHRKLGGLFQLCKRLDVTMDLRPVWQRMIG